MFNTLAYYATAFHRSFTVYTSQQLQQLGLNFGSLFLVIYVGKHPDCTQAELTEALGLDWGYSQRSVARLVQEGFLLREKTGRANHLNLSPKGQQAFAVGHQVFFDWDQSALRALTEPEREQLFSLLAKILREKEGEECTSSSKAHFAMAGSR